ncbi:MerR family DNA-binding transcriptional regulator [Paenibacillus baimaensis]|uniref:MerR family DNA-binding transcriptional regulator n=1 Tax=Paenibacillus baimaensis TaxID=2982185 RepID=UPI002FCCCF0E
MNYDVDTGKNLAHKKGDDHETGVQDWRTCKINRITVRTLRYCDQIGLLPSGHTESGIHTSTGLVIILKSIRMS